MVPNDFRFRWVELQVASVCNSDCADDVEEALEQLPPTLEATYLKTIERIGRARSNARFVIENTLKLLICAEKPMSPQTLLEAVSIRQDGRVVPVTKLEMIRMSQSLIV